MTMKEIASAVGVVLTLGLSSTTADAETTLTFASAAPAPAPINRAFEAWAQKVTEATGGEVTINVVAGGTLGRNGQLLDRVQSGVIDIAWDFQGYYPNRFPLSSVAELPFIYETALEGSIATQTLFDEGVISGEYDDFVTIGLFAFPNNSVILSQWGSGIGIRRSAAARSTGPSSPSPPCPPSGFRKSPRITTRPRWAGTRASP